MLELPPPTGPETPVVVSGRSSAAEASQPDGAFDQRFHTYESNPLPWWLTLIWIAFLMFGFTYLMVNLINR